MTMRPRAASSRSSQGNHTSPGEPPLPWMRMTLEVAGSSDEHILDLPLAGLHGDRDGRGHEGLEERRVELFVALDVRNRGEQ